MIKHQCMEGTEKELPGTDKIVLLVKCQREDKHEGKHAALWFNGFLTWEHIDANRASEKRQ
jgi:hypothetical protein